jgi:CRP-like cAMP-binding protein
VKKQYSKHIQQPDENDSSQPGIRNIIQAINNISPMPEADLVLLFPILQRSKVKKHEILLREGEVCRNIYFLIDGFFRMYYVDYDGNEINYRFTDKNNFFVDFQSFLMRKPSHFYWQAMQDAELFALSYQDIKNTYAASPAWNSFGRLMAEHVYLQLNERVEMLLFMSPEERYKYLLDNRPELFTQVSQFHLSSYLGVKPESLSRLRKRLFRK